MTIFYSGKVNVYDGVPPEKVNESHNSVQPENINFDGMVLIIHLVY